ncbi:MAG: hypothetical protein KKD18_02470 [Nanoarchaeota archaeon]|nr:hypothetical protein [Nanoarchaeota archaeon]MBU0977255.1 hypothetical protein [Nanoarchaeota archaeon]
MEKRGYELSFSWIFTIIVGAFIIFLAIYFAIRLVSTEQFSREAKEGKSIGILLTPVETQVEEGKFAKILLRDKTVLFNKCEPPATTNPFGSQNIGTSVNPPIGQRVSLLNGTMSTFHNKYIFTSSYGIQGDEEMYVLSKPLWLPFKVADLLIIWSDQEKYCFKNPVPDAIKSRLQALNLEKVRISTTCDADEIDVCFTGGTSCTINVDINQHKVTKVSAPPMYYLDSLEDDPYAMLYAAIFSDPANYECQKARILAHIRELIKLYLYKSEKIIVQGSTTGCSSNSLTYLGLLDTLVGRVLSGTSDLNDINQYVQSDPDFKNFQTIGGGRGCELF